MVNREQVRHRLLTNIVRNDAPGAFPTSVFYSLVAYLFRFSKNDRVSSSIGSTGCLPPFLSSFRSTHTCAHETFVRLLRRERPYDGRVSSYSYSGQFRRSSLFSIGPRCFAVDAKRKVVGFLNRFELVEHRRAFEIYSSQSY